MTSEQDHQRTSANGQSNGHHHPNGSKDRPTDILTRIPTDIPIPTLTTTPMDRTVHIRLRMNTLA